MAIINGVSTYRGVKRRRKEGERTTPLPGEGPTTEEKKATYKAGFKGAPEAKFAGEVPVTAVRGQAPQLYGAFDPKLRGGGGLAAPAGAPRTPLEARTLTEAGEMVNKVTEEGFKKAVAVPVAGPPTPVEKVIPVEKAPSFLERQKAIRDELRARTDAVRDEPITMLAMQREIAEFDRQAQQESQDIVWEERMEKAEKAKLGNQFNQDLLNEKIAGARAIAQSEGISLTAATQKWQMRQAKRAKLDTEGQTVFDSIVSQVTQPGFDINDAMNIAVREFQKDGIDIDDLEKARDVIEGLFGNDTANLMLDDFLVDTRGIDRDLVEGNRKLINTRRMLDSVVAGNVDDVGTQSYLETLVKLGRPDLVPDAVGRILSSGETSNEVKRQATTFLNDLQVGDAGKAELRTIGGQIVRIGPTGKAEVVFSAPATGKFEWRTLGNRLVKVAPYGNATYIEPGEIAGAKAEQTMFNVDLKTRTAALAPREAMDLNADLALIMSGGLTKSSLVEKIEALKEQGFSDLAELASRRGGRAITKRTATQLQRLNIPRATSPIVQDFIVEARQNAGMGNETFQGLKLKERKEFALRTETYGDLQIIDALRSNDFSGLTKRQVDQLNDAFGISDKEKARTGIGQKLLIQGQEFFGTGKDVNILLDIMSRKYTVDRIRDISGLAVTDKERTALEQILPNVNKFSRRFKYATRDAINDMDETLIPELREYGFFDTEEAFDGMTKLKGRAVQDLTRRIQGLSTVELLARDSVFGFELPELEGEAAPEVGRFEKTLKELYGADWQLYNTPGNRTILEETWKTPTPPTTGGYDREAQCGAFVNDTLGLSGVDRMGDTLASKMDSPNFRKGGEPIVGGYFVMDTGTTWGHAGIVDDIDENGIYITDRNWQGTGQEQKAFIPRGSDFYNKIVGYGSSTRAIAGKGDLPTRG